jgi:hypothetical protein
MEKWKKMTKVKKCRESRDGVQKRDSNLPRAVPVKRHLSNPPLGLHEPPPADNYTIIVLQCHLAHINKFNRMQQEGRKISVY